MIDRWEDEDGALWPITGYYCSICGLPMIPVNGSTAHPLCETEERTP